MRENLVMQMQRAHAFREDPQLEAKHGLEGKKSGKGGKRVSIRLTIQAVRES